MRELLHVATRHSQELVDITEAVSAVVRRRGIADGLVHIYAQGATAAVMIQENWDESVQEDVIDFLSRPIPKRLCSVLQTLPPAEDHAADHDHHPHDPRQQRARPDCRA